MVGTAREGTFLNSCPEPPPLLHFSHNLVQPGMLTQGVVHRLTRGQSPLPSFCPDAALAAFFFFFSVLNVDDVMLALLLLFQIF